MTIESLERLAIGDGRAAADALLERCLEQRVRIEIGRQAIENVPREVQCDAGFLEPTARAQEAVAARDELVAGDRGPRPLVVQRPLAQKASDGRVDGVGRVTPPTQSVSKLECGQFTSGEKGQACGVGGLSTIVQTW